MRITTTSVTYGRKFNLGNYEQLTVELTLAAELDEQDNPTEAQALLFQQAKAQAKAQALPVITAGKNGVVEAFMALPEDQQSEIMDLAYSVKRNGLPNQSNELDEYFPRNESNQDYLDHGDK